MDTKEQVKSALPNTDGASQEVHACNRIAAATNANLHLRGAGLPTYDDLVEMLDNVTAALETVLAHYEQHMPAADVEQRCKLIDASHALQERVGAA